jgi:phosphoglycerate dehydrogenase-like enzyme
MAVLLTWTPTAPEMQQIEATWPPELERYILDELTEQQRDEVLPRVEIIVGYMRSVTTDLLRGVPNLRLVHVLGHGVDGLFTPENVALLKERGAQVARSNPSSENIAEFVIMKMIAISRRVMQMHNRLVIFGDWSNDLVARRGEGVLGGELYRSTLGLIGYGNISQEIHKRARAFDMSVGALVRTPSRYAQNELEFVLPFEEIEDFLSRCDYVVLSLPLTEATTHMMNRRTFAAMKQGSYIVNISRGAIIDEEALHEALESGQLAGAALDVFESEERGFKAGYPTPRPIHHYNVLLTPHYAGATKEARGRGLANVGDNIRRLMQGHELRNAAEYERGF